MEIKTMWKTSGREKEYHNIDTKKETTKNTST